ncbi:unnamed protein product, partial [Discosporangium mesarthrocarpum]
GREGGGEPSQTQAASLARLPPCYAIVVSGVPPREQLFNTSLCNQAGPLGGVQERLHRRVENRRGRLDAEVGAAIPLFLRVGGGGRGKGKGRPNKGLDIVFAVSTGVVTSYTQDGVVNWQDHRGPKWDKEDKEHAGYVVLMEAKVDPGGSVRVTDAVEAEDQHILVVGKDEMVIFSRAGQLLGSAHVPFPPSAPPVVGDFNGDGSVDIILVGDGVAGGFTVRDSAGTGALLVLVLLTVGVMLVVAATRVPEGHGPYGVGVGGGIGVVKRATD